MKLVEIASKLLVAQDRTFAVLESYSDPANELVIKFKQSENNPTTWYAYVTEKSTNIPVVEVFFSLKAGAVDIGNIMPSEHPKHNKLVHTSLGTQYNGVDMGTTSIRWLFKKIKEFAISQGIEVKKISSTSRYTGARAKNNPGDEFGMPKSFNVDTPVKESIQYDCLNDTFKIV